LKRNHKKHSGLFLMVQ